MNAGWSDRKQFSQCGFVEHVAIARGRSGRENTNHEYNQNHDSAETFGRQIQPVKTISFLFSWRVATNP